MSIPTSFTLKWVGPKQDRAVKIPDAEWAKQKPRLRELYSKLTLPELMRVMKAEDFKATRKQFDYQFRKWGWKKYNMAAEKDQRPSGAVQSHLPTVIEDKAAIMTSFSRKRRQNTRSVENRRSRFRYSSQNPSNKKFKVDNEGTALKYQNLDLPPVPPTSNLYQSDINLRSLNDKLGEDKYNITPKSTISPTDLSIHSGGKTPAIGSTTDTTSTETEASSDVKTQASTDSGDFGTLLSLESIQSFEGDEFIAPSSTANQSSATISEDIIYQRHLVKAVKLTMAARAFSPRMLTSLFGSTNQSHLFSAADYLDAVWNKKRAFDIYRGLLNLEQVNLGDMGKSQILSPIALSCARAAETPWQRDIVKEVLLRRMTASNHAISPSENMLSHMLLAQMFALDQQHTLAKHHFESIQKMIAGCDSSETSFDILAYLYHKKPGSRMLLLPGEKNRKSRSISAQLRSVNHGDFVRFALDLRYSSLSYGPITIDRPDPSTAVSEYLRSCIDWCAISINCIVPGAMSFTAWLREESSLPSTSRWADILALYNYLHRKWRCKWHGPSQGSTTRWKWMDGTREALGISAAELLVVCCGMAIHSSASQSGHNHDNIATGLPLDKSKLQMDFGKIQDESDEDLVTIFLQHLYLRAVPFIWANGSTVTGAGAPRESKYEPTIASSLRSSNLSFRMMKDAAESLAKRRFNVGGSEASLSSRRETMASFAESIDTMSDMMRDSLSISDTRERAAVSEFNTSG